ncbi:MAG: hypothetical protein E7379_02695 [Clostridiales bacterium]|nr:hypothetical protein [Clostridiales bacterium]
MKKKIATALGVALVIPCALSLAACIDKGPKMDTWDGTVASLSVEEGGVININSAEELAGFAVAVNQGNKFENTTIRLACDLDMANLTWTPIGLGHRSDLANAKVFSGIFDGNGKKIINLSNVGYVPNAAHQSEESDLPAVVVGEGDNAVEIFTYTYHYGLFGMVVDATIKNLEVTVNYNCNQDYLKGDGVGGIVGFSSGALTIDNCVVNGTINGGYDAIGGLVGRAYKSSVSKPIVIENSENNADVTGLYKVSGILGFMSSTDGLNVKINQCVNNGDITSIGAKIDTGKETRFVSMASGITLYGWTKSVNSLAVITNNVNNGDLTICENLAGDVKANQPAYAAIAGQVNVVFDTDVHKYDFAGNTNTGKVFALGEEVAEDDIMKAYAAKVFAPYADGYDVNGNTNIVAE